MIYLFIHPVFPGQFHKLMEALAAKPGNQVWHLSNTTGLKAVPGVKRLQYRVKKHEGALPHPFLGQFVEALHHGDAVAAVLLKLKQQGFKPDLIYSYAGWGHGFYIKDVFPDVPVVGYFEWYSQAFGGEYNFDPEYPLDLERQRLLRVMNARALLDLDSFDHGVTPTQWQRSRFPKQYQDKLHCVHDGVDAARYRPAPAKTLDVPGAPALDLSQVELLTYSTRGMEPFRGFPQFMRALVQVQRQRPHCHAVIVGADEIFYSRRPEGAATYKQLMLAELAGQLDLSRVHFTGWLQGAHYLSVLQASAVHVYMSYPYVLSWSLMEAMSTGCLVVGSRTPPVQEMIEHGRTGFLVDFFDHEALAQAIVCNLADRAGPACMAVREQARRKIVDEYALGQVVPRHAALLQAWSDPRSA